MVANRSALGAQNYADGVIRNAQVIEWHDFLLLHRD
jgi:hypothetical protein